MERPSRILSSFRFSESSLWPRTPVGDWAMRGAGRVVRGLLRSVGYVQDVTWDMGLNLSWQGFDAHDPQDVRKWLEEHAWPARPLQLGILEPSGWGSDIMEAPGVLNADWIALSNSEVGRGSIPDTLDAVVANFPDGSIQVRTHELTGRPSAWYDWANERPRGYPGTFPTRIDCSQATIASHAPGKQPHPGASRLLIESAALLARHPARVSINDALVGREQRGAALAANADEHADPLAPAMLRLVELLSTWEHNDLSTPIAKVAARLMGAWAASGASPNTDESLRRVACDLAGSILENDVETQLRVGAVRLADGDDAIGLGALERAARGLHGVVLQSPPDQMLFVLAEMHAARSDPYSIGRMAAGLTLVGATTPKEKFAYLRDDILDEVRYSGALIDLEQDQLVILRTFGMLERVLGVEPRAQTIVDQHDAKDDAIEFSGDDSTWCATPKPAAQAAHPQASSVVGGLVRAARGAVANARSAAGERASTKTTKARARALAKSREKAAAKGTPKQTGKTAPAAKPLAEKATSKPAQKPAHKPAHKQLSKPTPRPAARTLAQSTPKQSPASTQRPTRKAA